MASALAVLADDTVKHGPLKSCIAMTEETGYGRCGLQPGWFTLIFLSTQTLKKKVKSTWVVRVVLMLKPQ